MTIHELVTATLTPVLANTWANELPPAPVWPAMLFSVDTAPEPGWAAGGDEPYVQHEVTVMMLARTVEEIDALEPQVNDAMEITDGYMFAGDVGDGDYEQDPQVFCRYAIFRLRSRRT